MTFRIFGERGIINYLNECKVFHIQQQQHTNMKRYKNAKQLFVNRRIISLKTGLKDIFAGFRKFSTCRFVFVYLPNPYVVKRIFVGDEKLKLFTVSHCY